MARGGIVLVAVVATVAMCRTARGQATDPGAVEPELAPVKDPKLGRRWLATAQRLMQRGSYYASNNRPDDARPQFENAVAAYRKAIEASDDIGLYVELANAEARLGKVDEAVRHLRLVVRAGVRPEVMKRATAKLDDLSSKIGIVTLTVAPAGTAITLGGSEIGTSPLPEALVLLPGTYALAFEASGYLPLETEIKVEAGSEIERAIELAPVQPTEPPVVSRPLPKTLVREAPPPRARWPLYAGTCVTGAAVAGAGVFGILALIQHSTFTAAATSNADRSDARTRGERYALIADVSLGTAVVAGSVTAYWYFYRYKRPSRRPDAERSGIVATKLGVVPWVQPQSGGVTFTGRF